MKYINFADYIVFPTAKSILSTGIETPEYMF